jgi:regulator of replication initiation timing
LKRRLQEAGDLNRKLVEYENKIVLLSQEMERLNVIISNKIEENQKLSAQNEELRRKVMEFNEVNRRIPEYEQKILLIIQ